MAYDAAQQQVVLFGGSGPGRTTLGDTWVWDGSGWTRADTTGPTARGSHQMVFDQQQQRVVLFGGYDGTVQNDAWTWDGNRWQAWPMDEAPPRLHHSLSYLSNANQLAVFGGFGEAGREPSTWLWDGSRWAQQEGAAPPARAEHDAVVMPDVGLVVFGGVVGQEMAASERQKANDVWIFDADGWRAWSASPQ